MVISHYMKVERNDKKYMKPAFQKNIFCYLPLLLPNIYQLKLLKEVLFISDALK